MSMNPPRLSLAFEFHVDVGAPIDVGPIARGRRRVIPITGGRFEGSGMTGTIAGGSDHQIVRDDDVIDIEAKYTLQTSTGVAIAVHSVGIRHAPAEVMKALMAGEPVNPDQVYFRTALAFETAAPELWWMMRSLFVGVGERHPHGVVMRVWRLE